ncbi:MAG TPA: hypothetical protein VGS41_03630 [Chthonomonadales bacterium]|nr:hypothetical protein [Chthonomonadales bacterium]
MTNLNAPSEGEQIDRSADEEPVLLLNAASEEEAEVVCATLQAAGINATLSNPSPNAGIGIVAETVGNTWFNGVYVAGRDVEPARAVLNAPETTEADLTAEEEADPTTLEGAEARTKNL